MEIQGIKMATKPLRGKEKYEGKRREKKKRRRVLFTCSMFNSLRDKY